MFRSIVALAIGSLFAGIGGGAAGYGAPQPVGNKPSSVKAVRVPGTSLSISLPAGWEIVPAMPGGFATTAIRYKGSPGFEVTVRQNDTVLHAEYVTSLPFECDVMFGALHAALKFQLVQRPDFIPGEYYSRILVPPPPKQGEVMSTCLYLGNSEIAFMVRPAPSSGDGSKLTPLLQAIVDSSKQTSTLLYAPGSLKLSVMRATVLMSSGIWAAGSTSLPGSIGKTDLLVRISGKSELKIFPKVSPGPCSLWMSPNRKKAPLYVSAKWEPFAWEAPTPDGQLELMVCRQIEPAKMLLVSMEYGSPAVSSEDASEIATALDEIAEAILRGQH